MALIMAKKKKTKQDATAPRRKRTPKYTVVQMDMALMEFVRSGGSNYAAEKATGVHHTQIQRAWEGLTENERNEYRLRARDVCDAVTEQIFQKEVAIVSEVTAKLKEISDLALDELRDRLKDDARKWEMKDADLINIATKCLAIVDTNTKQKEEEDAKQPTSITNIFNILDNSIQENLQLNTFNYDDEDE